MAWRSYRLAHSLIPVDLLASGQGLVLEFIEGIAFLRRVDSENHTLGAMRERNFLSAIKPEGILSIRNEKGFGNEFLACSNELEPGVKSMVEVSARFVEGRLGDGMILRDECEANFVTRFRIHMGWGVGKATILANGNVDDLSRRLCRSERLLLEGIECLSLLFWVDGKHHAFAAVTRLSAVEP